MTESDTHASRNPKGAGRRPGSVSAATLAIRQLASEHGQSALDALVEVMTDHNNPPASRVQAANALLDRGYGKSVNVITVEFDPPLSQQSPADAVAAITDKVTAGELPIDEGQKLTSIIESRIKAVELAELDDRLKALEGK